MAPTHPVSPPVVLNQPFSVNVQAFSRGTSFFISLIVHVLFFVILALTWHRTSTELPLQLTAVVDKQELGPFVAMNFQPVSVPETTSSELLQTEPIKVEPPQPVSIDQLRLDDQPSQLAAENLRAKELAKEGSVLASKPEPRLITQTKSVDSIPASARQPKLTEGANYYGINAPGSRFVFVVDSSTSMAGIRWESAVSELLTCLAHLPADSEFYVIFFSDRTEYMFRSRPSQVAFQPNTFESLARTKQWIFSINLGRSTQPFEALRKALQMEPDAIFLLSDGEFRDATLTWLRTVTKRRKQAMVPIHAIGLFSKAGLSSLQEVAALSGGEFRQILSMER